jgi:hypothetical protein
LYRVTLVVGLGRRAAEKGFVFGEKLEKHTLGLERARKKGKFPVKSTESVPQGLKPTLI